MPPPEYDVIVIGAGIMGSCAAYHIARRGRSVLLLEQFDLLHCRGSSHGESRTIRAAYPEPHYAHMVIDSARLWAEAQSEIGYQVYFPAPQLDMGPAGDPTLAAVVESCKSAGLGHRVLSSEQLSGEFSGRVAVPDDWVAVISDLGGVVKATKAVAMFQSLALRNGAVLKDNVEITGIEKRDGGITVLTAGDGKIDSRKCVVTAGAWTRKLIGSVTGEDIPIQPLEVSIMYWKIKEGQEGNFSLEGGFPTFSGYGDPPVYGTPALEFPGLIKVACHAGLPCEPGSRTWVPVPGSKEKLGEWVRERFASLVKGDKPAMVQSCMYSCTSDEDYVIDFVGGGFEKDVVVAGGFSGHGFKMGPLIGRILADMVTEGRVEGVEMEHFGINRFKANPKGNVKEFGGRVGES